MSAVVGGNGTKYNASYITATYARVDASGTPGYFTYKASANNVGGGFAEWFADWCLIIIIAGFLAIAGAGVWFVRKCLKRNDHDDLPPIDGLLNIIKNV